MSTPDSPSDDVTFRPSNAPTPTFAGMTPNLPSALRALRRPKNARPSEMTALASRLGGIRLDYSPEECEPSPNQHPTPQNVNPLKLEFTEPQEAAGKENTFLPNHMQPDASQPFALSTSDRSTADSRSPSITKSASPTFEVSNSALAPSETDDILSDGTVSSPPTAPIVTAECTDQTSQSEQTEEGMKDEAALASPLQDHTASSKSNSPIPNQSQLPEDNNNSPSTPVSTEQSVPESDAAMTDTPDEHVSQATDGCDVSNTATSGEPTFSEDKSESPSGIDAEVVPAPTESDASISAETGKLSPGPKATEEVENSGKDQTPPAVKEDESLAPLQVSSPHSSDQVMKEKSVPAVKIEDTILSTEASSTPSSPGVKKEQSILLVKEEEKLAPVEASSPSTAPDVQKLTENMDKIIAGKSKWKWPARCKAFKAMSSTVQNDFTEEMQEVLRDSLPTLATKVKEHLGELRPSIITAALHFFDAIVSSPLSAEEFALQAFPAVLEIASGHSLRAQDAAGSLSLAVHEYPSLKSSLEDLENPQRLCEVMEMYLRDSNGDRAARMQNLLGVIKERNEALKTLQLSENTSSIPSALATPSNGENKPPAKQKILQFRDDTSDKPIVQGQDVAATSASSAVDGQKSEVQSSVGRIRSLRYSRMSWRAKLETPTLLGKQGILNEVLEADITGNDGSSNRSSLQSRDANGSSPHKGRVYSQEEVEEIRQTAIETVIEKLGETHNEKCEELEQQNISLQQKLKKEHAENRELKSVLEEFELTMSKMVSEGNSQANAQHLSLQREKNDLKAEILEVSEAFEKLKEKYEMAKQTIELMETKENRFIEQNQDLKKSMVELQQWSNDLKANTEKKLNKAFESVTFFRSSCLEHRAHATKAASDLAKVKDELEKETSNHRETATKLSQYETDLHREQDTRVELSGQLSTVKLALQKSTTHRDSLQKDVDASQKELNELKDKVTEMESTATRLSDLQKNFDVLRSERQELKARAFDDITKVRQLERQVEIKEKELDDLGGICDEVMSQLEEIKLGRS